MVTQKSEETRIRIADGAFALFCRHGFQGASMRDIAHAAGVPASVIYYYWKSKEELYASIMYDKVVELFARLRGEVPFSDAIPVEDVYTAFLEVRTPDRLSHEDLYVARMAVVEWVGNRGDTPLRARLRALIDEGGQSVRTYLGARSFQGRSVSPRAADLLYGYMQYESLRNLFGIREFERGRVRETICLLLASRDGTQDS